MYSFINTLLEISRTRRSRYIGMDCLLQISIEGIGGLESSKGKNLIDILSGQAEQPSFFIRTSGTLGRNVIRFSTNIKRKRHQIAWQQNFYRRASGLRVEWDDQYVKDKSQIPVNKPRSGTVSDGKSKLLFEFVRIDKFESDFVVATTEINPIRVNILNAGSGDLDSVCNTFYQVLPLDLQGSLIGDIGSHNLSLRVSFCCVPIVIPDLFSLPVKSEIPISFQIVIKEAKNVPINILKAATSFLCFIGSARTNAVLPLPDTLDPYWDETIPLTIPVQPFNSQHDLDEPYLAVKLYDHRGSGIPDAVIGEGILSLWEFFAGVSKEKSIRVPLLRSGCEGEPTSSDSRGYVVLHITEPLLTHETANLLNNAYHGMAIKKMDELYERSRSTKSTSISGANRTSDRAANSSTSQLKFLSNGSRHLKCTIICCMEDSDEEKALLENEILSKMQKLLASLDIGVEFSAVYFDSAVLASPHLLRLLVQKIFQCELCIFILGFIPGALMDYSVISQIFDTDFDARVDTWLRSHFKEHEERYESVIEVLSHAAEFVFREDSHVTEKVLMFQRKLSVSEIQPQDNSDNGSATEMSKSKVYNAAAVDRISRRIASFGASCFAHDNSDSFAALVLSQLISSVKSSRLNGFQTHSLLNSSIFELQFMRSADTKPSQCHIFNETHAFKTAILSLVSCSSGQISPPLLITSEDSLSSKLLYCALCSHMRSISFRSIGSDVTKHSKLCQTTGFKPCFMYDFSTSAGSKAPVTFLRALLQGLRAILASEPCILNDDINFESGSTCSELIVLVKPYLKAAIEEYTSFSILLSGTECLDPDTLQSILCVAPARPIPGLWICALLGTQDTKYSCKMQSIFFGALPCACMCAVVRSHIDNDAALVLIEECGIRHSSLETVLKKFRCHPNLCSLASFVSAISHSFANCCGSDTTQMFIQLAQSTPSSASFADILCDILVSMHSFDYGPNVFQYLMLCSRSRYGLQPSDLSSMSNVSSSVHMVCVEILRAIGACVGCFCIIPFAEVYLAIEKVLATSADPRNAIRLCDAMLSKFFSSMPMKWKVVENLIFVTESTGDFAAICRRLLECGVQHYIISNEYCVQDFRSFWQFFCQHPAGESISQRTRLSNHLSGITAISKNSCSSIVVAAKFCCLISLYETANSILTSFKGLYQSNLDDDPGKVASNDWSNLCIVFALQGRLNLAWGRLDAAESILKEALTAHGAAIDSDHVASDVSPNFDASRSVCGRLLSEIASILLVRSRTREALSFADKSVAFINGIESCRRSKFLSPSCVLDIMLCAMEARMANDLKSGAFSVIDSALNVCDSEFGKFHPRSLAVYERLCSLNCISDKRSDALVMYQRILKDLTIQRTWGFDVTGKLTTIILLISDILVSNHEMIEAVGLCEHALKFRIERYGSEPNLQVARCLEKLAACRMLSKDPKSASHDLKDALKIRQALSDSKKDQDYFMCVLQLSGALKAAGYRSEARQHLKEWVEHLKAELGDNHDFVHTALDIIHSRMND